MTDLRARHTADRPGPSAPSRFSGLGRWKPARHIAACVSECIGGTESHILSALDMGIYPAESFGRVHHLSEARLTAVMDGLRGRDLIDAAGHFTDAGRECKERIEVLTDRLAAAPYDGLASDELDELIAELEPVSGILVAAGSS